MEADYESFEIACVIGGYQLIDSESYERRYRRSNGLPLAPGYYVVHWPDHIRARRFNEEALFHGPFRRRREAQAALERLRTVREEEASFPPLWQGQPSPSRGNPVSPFRVAAWFLSATILGLAASPSAEATAYANSTIAFSSLVITPTSGTVQLLDEWTTESYTDAKNSLGEADPHYLSSYPGGTAATNSSVTWAASHGDANASTPPALPELSVTANANSLANVPGCDPNWASSDGHGTLTNAFMVTGGTGQTAVNLSAHITGLLHVLTDQCGIKAETETIFTLQIFGLPDLGAGPQNPIVLFSDLHFVIGRNDEIMHPFDNTLTGSAVLDFDTPYGVLLEADSESFAVVPEPATLVLLLPGLGLLTRRKNKLRSSVK
jgi:hypothetical protein